MKLGIYLASGFEEIEALCVVDLVRRAEINIDMISINEEYMVTSSHNVSVKADKLIKDINFDDYDMMILPGGMPGTLNLEKCEILMSALDKYYEEKKPISAICAAPSILAHKGYLKDRNACSNPGFEKELKDAFVLKEPVVVSDFITTSRAMGTAIPFGLKIVERYKGKDFAKNLADLILYNK